MDPLCAVFSVHFITSRLAKVQYLMLKGPSCDHGNETPLHRGHWGEKSQLSGLPRGLFCASVLVLGLFVFIFRLPNT